MNIEYRYINKTILSDVIQNYTIYLFTVYEKMLGTLGRYTTLPSKIRCTYIPIWRHV